MVAQSTASAEAGVGRVRIPQARAPRAQISVRCTLRRRVGSPIAGETLDLGPEGMRVTCRRPLADDETLDFELQHVVMRIVGRALVLRQDRPHTYMLRFDCLPEPMAQCLRALAAAAARTSAAAPE